MFLEIPVTLIHTFLSLVSTQVLIKSESPSLFKEALIDKTQTDCRETQQNSRKIISFSLFHWEKDRGYLAQRVSVRLISEKGICLKAEKILSCYQQPHTATMWNHILLTMYSLKQIHYTQEELPGFIP